MDGVMMPSRLRASLRSAPCARSPTQHNTYPKISSAPDRCRVAARSRPPCVFYTAQNGSSSGQADAKPDDEAPKTSIRINGKIPREALDAWNKRVGGHCQRAPADVVQPLFNDLHLYPLRSQVFEMLVSARECSRRAELTLAFGEFCLFVAELRRRALRRTFSVRAKRKDGGGTSHSPSDDDKHKRNSNGENGPAPEPPSYEVFLGGSCNPTTWRWDVAIPTLDKMGITYFNPQVKEWSKDLMEIEHNAKQSARVLFFVLDAETRAAAAAVEAAHLAASTRARHLVLVLQPYRRGQHIGGELVPEQEYLDLSRGQAILQEVAERQNLLVFNDLDSALKCTQRLLRGNDPQFPLYKGESNTPAIAKHLFNLKHTFDNADENNVGSLSLNETIKAIKLLTCMDVNIEELKTIIDSENDQKNGRTATIYRCNSSNAINNSFSSLNPKIHPDEMNPDKIHADSVDFEMFCFILAELNADLSNFNDITVSPSYLRNLNEQVNELMIVDSEKSTIFLNTQNSDSEESTSDDLNDHQLSPCENDIRLDSSSMTDSKNPNESIRWRPGTGKWRQLLNCVQEAVLGFMSKLELNGILNRQSFNQYNSNRRHQTSNQNDMEDSKTEKNANIDSNVNIKEKLKNEAIHLKTVNKLSNSKGNVDKNSPNNGNRMSFVSKPAHRKLSLIIPKVLEENDKLGVFSPQTNKRLDGLAEAVREEIPQRDVYLGGAGVNRTNWREDVVIPMLKGRNYSYYIPAMNDYNRMFSAPPFTPAGVKKFIFDGKHEGPRLSKSSSETTIITTKNALSMKIFPNPSVIDNSNVVNSNTTTSSHNIDINNKLSISNVDNNEKLNLENGRLPHKHERSPTFENDHPEKRPKYSRDESPNKKLDLDDGEIELRNKEIPEVGYPLNTFNRLSASDFYKIPENASPAPFRGMYDERQLKNSRVLLFGVTRDTRCLTPMVLAAHWIGLRPRAVVLCVQLLNRTDGLTEQAVKDYNRGRMYLSDLARRENVPIFDNLEEATQCVIEKLENCNY